MLDLHNAILTPGDPWGGYYDAVEAVSPVTTEPGYFLICADAAGMSHSVNTGLERLITSGLPVAVSVMFPTPWYLETVEMLNRHPGVSVGIHLTLNSEWKNCRWGPVLGRSAAPTLVDSDGYFFPSAAALYANRPGVQEVEREPRAQIERAVRSGLRIDYVDYHMGTVMQYPRSAVRSPSGSRRNSVSRCPATSGSGWGGKSRTRGAWVAAGATPNALAAARSTLHNQVLIAERFR